MNRTDKKQKKKLILFFESKFCKEKIKISGPLKKNIFDIGGIVRSL